MASRPLLVRHSGGGWPHPPVVDRPTGRGGGHRGSTHTPRARYPDVTIEWQIRESASATQAGPRAAPGRVAGARLLTSQGFGHSLMRLPFPSWKDDSANHGFHSRSSPRARLELRDAPVSEQRLAVESLSHLVLACLVRTQNVHVAELLEVPVALRHLTEPPGSTLQRGPLCHADLHTRLRRQSRPGDRSRKTASWACGCTAAPGSGTIHAGEKSRD